jgi:hypothetical protein
MNKNMIIENKTSSKFLGYFFAVFAIFIWGLRLLVLMEKSILI